MKKFLLVVATVSLILATTASASVLPPVQQPHHTSIPTLRLTLSSGHVASVCTKPVSSAWTVAIWVHINGLDIQSPSTGAGSSMYYAGDGTLVRLKSYGVTAGPICARAITWLPGVTHVAVLFRVVAS